MYLVKPQWQEPVYGRRRGVVLVDSDMVPKLLVGKGSRQAKMVISKLRCMKQKNNVVEEKGQTEGYISWFCRFRQHEETSRQVIVLSGEHKRGKVALTFCPSKEHQSLFQLQRCTEHVD